MVGECTTVFGDHVAPYSVWTYSFFAHQGYGYCTVVGDRRDTVSDGRLLNAEKLSGFILVYGAEQIVGAFGNP